MKTYNLDLRHAPSKRRLNALPNNRLDPLKRRLTSDVEAIAWAQSELLDFARRARGAKYQYVEAALVELLPFGQIHDGKDYRRSLWDAAYPAPRMGPRGVTPDEVDA